MLYRLAFASVRGMNPPLARELLRLLGSERAFFEAPESQLRYVTSSRSRIYLAEYRGKLLDAARRELDFIRSAGIHAVYFTDADYPARLLQCDDAPLMLFTLGSPALLNPRRSLAVVGTRHATPYGIEFTSRLIEDLARLTPDVTIISGLAYGIDITAHRAALRHSLPTAAVLAHGLNTIYPADHRATAADMLKRGGALITEYLSSEPIHKGNFVARNRIVAGMADALMVVESAETGGALITAKLAADYSRDVFAVPGRVSDTYSAGCNRIIAANMAQLVRSAEDLCRYMSWPVNAPAVAAEAPALPLVLNPEEDAIVKFLEHNEDASVSQLTAATGMPVAQLMSLLIDLEFRGLLLSLPGARYRLT